MPGHNVLLNFPHGEQKVFLDVDPPAAGRVYTGADGLEWLVTEWQPHEGIVDGQSADFEATVELVAPAEPPSEWV